MVGDARQLGFSFVYRSVFFSFFFLFFSFLLLRTINVEEERSRKARVIPVMRFVNAF